MVLFGVSIEWGFASKLVSRSISMCLPALYKCYAGRPSSIWKQLTALKVSLPVYRGETTSKCLVISALGCPLNFPIHWLLYYWVFVEKFGVIKWIEMLRRRENLLSGLQKPCHIELVCSNGGCSFANTNVLASAGLACQCYLTISSQTDIKNVYL